MNFQGLMLKLEERLGYHQVPLNPRATSLKDLFEGGPLHHELMTRLVRAIYGENACRRLTDPVEREKTLAALGPLRLEFLRAASTDVDLHRLIEELCVVLAEAFGETRPIPTKAPRGAAAQVIPLDRFRPRRGLKSSA